MLSLPATLYEGYKPSPLDPPTFLEMRRDHAEPVIPIPPPSGPFRNLSVVLVEQVARPRMEAAASGPVRHGRRLGHASRFCESFSYFQCRYTPGTVVHYQGKAAVVVETNGEEFLIEQNGKELRVDSKTLIYVPQEGETVSFRQGSKKGVGVVVRANLVRKIVEIDLREKDELISFKYRTLFQVMPVPKKS